MPVPLHRLSPLKKNWEKIVTTIVVRRWRVFEGLLCLGKYEAINPHEREEKMR